MNTEQHLLVCLAEECTEVQHAIAKALRFGVDSYGQSGRSTNREQLKLELNDLMGVWQLLRKELSDLEVDYEMSDARIIRYRNGL